MVVWIPQGHLDRDEYLSATLRCNSPKLNLLDDFELILAGREDQVRVMRPRIQSIILDHKFLIDLLAWSHLEKVWILNAHETHGELHVHLRLIHRQILKAMRRLTFVFLIK